MISARGRPPPGSPDLPPSGREISGLEEMWAIRWSPPISSRRSRSWNSVSEGEWPGRCSTWSVRSANVSSEPSASGLVTLVEPPQARNERDTERSAVTTSRGMPWRSISALGQLVVALGVGGEVLDHRREQVERADLGVRAPGEDVDQPEVVDVLVGDDDPLEVLDPVAVAGERPLELVECLARVRPDVDQRQRLVLDQVAVHPPDHERRRDREAVDHERIRPRTSSRLASMSSCETSDSRVRRSSGSVFEGRTLKCQSS